MAIHMKSLGITVTETAVIYGIYPIFSILAPCIVGVIADKLGNFKVRFPSLRSFGSPAENQKANERIQCKTVLKVSFYVTRLVPGCPMIVILENEIDELQRQANQVVIMLCLTYQTLLRNTSESYINRCYRLSVVSTFTYALLIQINIFDYVNGIIVIALRLGSGL